MAASSPRFDVPKSTATVKVSIIDTTTRLSHAPTQMFLQPPIPGFDDLVALAFAFFIEHPSGDKYIFDLGVRKDWLNFSPAIGKKLKEIGFHIVVEKDVRDILNDNNIDASDINGIIWSHHHFDHTGDPSRFPATTDLIVGPGTKEAYMPGYPANPDAMILEADYSGRNVKQISFDKKSPMIGKFHALDFFNDGSFYLLDAPGHTIGHLCALARTTIGQDHEGDTFIMMGGDACHHGGEFRPSTYLPLPDSISPHPFVKSVRNSQKCLGAIFEKIHPEHGAAKVEARDDWRTKPFYKPGPVTHNMEDALETIHKIQVADAGDRVFFVMAHDKALLDLVEYFPATANDWYRKGWGRDGKWRFLSDFQKAVESGYEAGQE